MTFGERLIKAREKKGYKQNQLADLLGITATRLNYWEKDKREPDVLMIKKLALLLEVTCDWLIGNEEPNFGFNDNEKQHLNKYRSLDQYGKKAVDSIIDIEYERCSVKSESEKMILTTVAARTSDNSIKVHKEYVQDLSNFEPDDTDL